ncbi:MAG: hypothetical protein JW990_07980 [Thermoleophilia bacterium]|nr:hypothetical protein [Thermoleophilia bacterium]
MADKPWKVVATIDDMRLAVPAGTDLASADKETPGRVLQPDGTIVKEAPVWVLMARIPFRIDRDPGQENESWTAGAIRKFAQAVTEALLKNKGWAPGPNAGWRRIDDNQLTLEAQPTPEPAPELEPPAQDKRLDELEADAKHRLEEWEAKRSISTNRYRNLSPQELDERHRVFDRKVTNLKDQKRWAEPGGWGPGDEEALQQATVRLDDIRAENADRRAYYDLARQLKAVEMGREYGVPVLERADVERLMGHVGDAYRDAGVIGRGYMPEAFHLSDLSGQLVRWYVKLPDGRIAHPDEIHEARRRKRLVVVDSIVPENRDWTQD